MLGCDRESNIRTEVARWQRLSFWISHSGGAIFIGMRTLQPDKRFCDKFPALPFHTRSLSLLPATALQLIEPGRRPKGESMAPNG